MPDATSIKPAEPTLAFGPSPTGRGRRLEATLWLAQPCETIFEFFADVHNLEALTPPWLNFTIETPAPLRIQQGALINHRLRLHGIPIRWTSLISIWEPPFRFVDEQQRGPYRRWHHEHVFEPSNGGTLCRDVVDYQVLGGSLIDALRAP